MTDDQYIRTPLISQSNDKGSQSSIFRQRAVKHYLEGREEEVLPNFVSPRSFYLLWVAFVLLVAGVAAGAYLVHVPTYVSGAAAVTEREGEGGTAVTAFLPPGELAGLEKGNRLLLEAAGGGESRSLTVSSVPGGVLDPAEAAKRFGISEAEATELGAPAAVAVAPLEESFGAAGASSQAGGVYRAEVEVGSRRVVSLIPVVGEWFGSEGVE